MCMLLPVTICASNVWGCYSVLSNLKHVFKAWVAHWLNCLEEKWRWRVFLTQLFKIVDKAENLNQLMWHFCAASLRLCSWLPHPGFNFCLRLFDFPSEKWNRAVGWRVNSKERRVAHGHSNNATPRTPGCLWPLRCRKTFCSEDLHLSGQGHISWCRTLSTLMIFEWDKGSANTWVTEIPW